ncbi:MAG: hypothetical protein R2754_14530 [Microthrixaceae bacterium]
MMVALHQITAQQITADNPWPLIWLAWAVTFGTFGAYAVALVRRGRRLSSQVPQNRRRFLSSDGHDGATHG